MITPQDPAGSAQPATPVVAAAPAAPVPAAIQPATGSEKAAWILMGAGLIFVLHFGLLPALLAGLMMHGIIHAIARPITGKSLSHGKAKLVAVAIIGVIIVAVATALVLLLIAFLKGRMGGVPELFRKMAEIIETAWSRLGWADRPPAADELQALFAKTLREHAQELQHAGGEAGHIAVHILAGMVVGALSAFEMRVPIRPLAVALSQRMQRLADAFEKVVFAQIKISGVNTLATALYLLAILPLCGVELPLRKTLVVVTFILGMIPVLGNLGSNTAIVVIALGVSPPVAIASLAFLIIIHKLEYFLNARIVGDQIKAAAWEILLAMICFEAAFGLAGVIIAPIVYAYAKKELSDRALI